MLRLQPEHWILAALLALFGALAGFKAQTLPSGAETSGAAGKSPQKIDFQELDGLPQRIENPAVIPDSAHKVYASRLIVYYPSTGEIKPLDLDAEGPDGIRIQWKIDHGFPLDDAGIAAADPDGDGFSNLEEYKAGTDPRAPGSRPGLLGKLRVAAYNYVPFRMIFKGYNPDASTGELTFQINLLDARNRTRIVKSGGEIEGYKIANFRKKIVERFNPRTGTSEQRDESELDLINAKLGETVTLVFNQIKESDNSTAVFKLEVPDARPEPAEVRRGGTFKIQDATYQLLKADQTTATIRDIATGKTYQVGPEGAREAATP